MIREAANQIFQHVTHHLNLGAKTVDFDDDQGRTRQIRTHQDEPLLAMLDHHTSKPPINWFPKHIEATRRDGCRRAIARHRCRDDGNAVGSGHDVDQCHAFLLSKSFHAGFGHEVSHRIVFGPGDEMRAPRAVLGESFVENQEGWTDRKVGVQHGIARAAHSVSHRQQETSHPDDHGGGLHT